MLYREPASDNRWAAPPPTAQNPLPAVVRRACRIGGVRLTLQLCMASSYPCSLISSWEDMCPISQCQLAGEGNRVWSRVPKADTRPTRFLSSNSQPSFEIGLLVWAGPESVGGEQGALSFRIVSGCVSATVLLTTVPFGWCAKRGGRRSWLPTSLGYETTLLRFFKFAVISSYPFLHSSYLLRESSSFDIRG